MTDGAPALSKDEIREEARQILTALDANRLHHQKFEDNWRKLWQLAREARAADLPIRKVDGPWHINYGANRLSPHLIADGFKVPIWPTANGRSEPDLARLLNWAGVPVPDG